MVDYLKERTSTVPQSAEYDEGLRQYLLQVFNYMAGGLLLTGIVALAASQSEAVMSLFYHMQDGRIAGAKPLGWVVMLAPLALVMLLSFRMEKMSFRTAQMAYWGYAAVMGLSLASIFLIYTGASVTRVFFITSAMFGGMALYGYTTKRDLSGLRSFLIMGVWGLIIASLVNIFLGSSTLHFAVSILGVVIFTGLTAYDMQKIKHTYYAVAGQGEWEQKVGLMGALSLYLDFINLFISLLRLVGERR